MRLWKTNIIKKSRNLWMPPVPAWSVKNNKKRWKIEAFFVNVFLHPLRNPRQCKNKPPVYRPSAGCPPPTRTLRFLLLLLLLLLLLCSTFLDMMNDIGSDKKQQRYISKKMINIAIRATYYIFCFRKRDWDSPDLMQFRIFWGGGRGAFVFVLFLFFFSFP